MDSKELLNQLSKTNLYKLACVQLKREGKLNLLTRNSVAKVYLVDPAEAILKGLEILTEATNRKIKI